MTDERMVENLWSLANGITSFAVLQALAFLYALGREDFVKAITIRLAQRAIFWATLMFTAVYCFPVWKCWRLAAELDCHRSIWLAVTLGRICCIGAFNGMVLGIDVAIARARGVRRVADA